MTDRRAIVAGAGIGGLAAAVALRARGWVVDVHEREPALGEAGAGLQLSPNALRPLFALGLESRLRKAGTSPEAAEIRRGGDGALLHRVPYGEAERRWGAPYLHLHRADLHAILVEATEAAGVRLRLGSPVLGATPDGVITFASGGGDSAALVVAADGLRSPVAVGLGLPPAPPTGRSAWRALIPAERLGPDPLPPLTRVWIGRGRHLVAYPLRGGALLNLVAVTSGEAAASWTAAGDAAALRARFDGWAEPVPTLMAALADAPLWRGALTDGPPRPRWAFGRVALLGDAAHPMSPSFAQGAGMAIEDAAAVAQETAHGAVAAALERYARKRRARVASVQRQSRLNGVLFHLPETLSSALFRAAAALDRADPLARFDRLYGGGPARARRAL